jgi:hypothetical protein
LKRINVQTGLGTTSNLIIIPGFLNTDIIIKNLTRKEKLAKAPNEPLREKGKKADHMLLSQAA